MPSSYSPLLGIELIANGEQSGNWGTTTNNNLGTLLEQAIAKLSNVTVSGTSYTLANSPDGTAYESRSMALNIQGVLSATCDVICPSKTKLYVVKNATTGGQSIVIKTSVGTGITVANGATAIVLCDGTNVIDPVSSKLNTTGGALSGNLSFTGSATRIQGDFSNATLANRTSFQTSTTNDSTGVSVLPNGTGSVAAVTAFNNSNPTNAAFATLGISSGNAALTSGNTGSGTALPLIVYVGNGSPEVARFTTSGAYLIGSASSSAGYDGASWKWIGYQINSRNTTADTNQIVFYNPNGQVGFINSNGTSTTYSTSSDYRLKNNPQPLTGSGAFIDALQPKTWTWVTDGAAGVGFIAHEVAAVSPNSVSGQKDAVNVDGTPKYQGMEYGSAEFIANIVAELKSLRARVAALEAK
jgi:hypothetical protein